MKILMFWTDYLLWIIGITSFIIVLLLQNGIIKTPTERTQLDINSCNQNCSLEIAPYHHNCTTYQQENKLPNCRRSLD